MTAQNQRGLPGSACMCPGRGTSAATSAAGGVSHARGLGRTTGWDDSGAAVHKVAGRLGRRRSTTAVVMVSVLFHGGRREMEREVNVMMESCEFTQVPFHRGRREMEREVKVNAA